MLNAFVQAIWLALPLILGGAVHIAVIRLDLLPGLARVPLDGGRSFRGRRFLGDHKTVRGVVTMIAATTGFAVLQAAVIGRTRWAAEPPLHDLTRIHPLLCGLVLGGGYVVGELPNSFVKRQLGVAPGECAPGALRPLCWLCDQLDSLAGVLACLSAVWVPSLPVGLLLGVLTLIVHPAMGLVMVALGLKRRVG